MMRMMVPALAALVLTACQTGDAGPPPPAGGGATPSLAGSSWRLVAIQSMDDAQGTTRPDEPSKYTLSFGADGRVVARLDCNRGAGSWKSAGPGQLEIGQLATTRAMCPPPSLGDRLGRDLGFVRTYLVRDGRLHLSLMADGGILSWEPMNAAAP